MKFQLEIGHSLIKREWKSVIENNKCMKGKRDAFITASNLSASVNKQNPQGIVYKKIDSLITNL